MTHATEVRLFKIGANTTEKGTYILTAADNAAVAARYRRRGTGLSFDYSHDEAKPSTGGPIIAAGWGALEARPDGLWAVGITWTALAAKHMAARELRYVSPLFEFEARADGNHVTNVINVGLTNIPATHGTMAIAASATTIRTARGALQPIPHRPAVALSSSEKHHPMKIHEASYLTPEEIKIAALTGVSHTALLTTKVRLATDTIMASLGGTIGPAAAFRAEEDGASDPLESDPAELSPEELKLCKQMGIDPAAVLRAKSKMRADGSYDASMGQGA